MLATCEKYRKVFHKEGMISLEVERKLYVFKGVKQDKEEEKYWMRGEQPQMRMENGVGV